MEELPKARTVFRMADSLYDKLKFAALVLLPAAGALYFALGTIWGWGSLEQVLGTILAVETFIGAVLGISNAQHKKEIEERPNSKLILGDDGEAYAEFAFDPTNVSAGDQITLDVIRPQ